MAEVIKKLAVNVQDRNVEDQFDRLIEQVEHKNNVLLKEDGLTKVHTIGVGDVITIVNGQITKVE